jgi:Rieske 2Fe-2S family protein
MAFVNTTLLPVAASRTLPRDYFVSRRIFDQEMAKIFADSWLCLGRADRLSAAGEYFLQQIGDYSLIVVRDRAGTIRAFHNTCRHRGTRLCEKAAGRLSETIQCPYHAWTYALDGRLIGAPSVDAIDDFRKSDHSLFQAATHTWEGFLYVNVAERPEPFDLAYAPLIARFSRFNLPMLRVGHRIEYDVKANWKLVVQNYQECYHCALVHPTLTKMSPPTSGEIDLYEGPFLGGYMTLTEGHETLSLSGRACGLAVGDLAADDQRRVYYYSLFPNVLLSLHHDYVMVHTLWPVEPGRTSITCEWLFHPDSIGDPRWNTEDGVAFWDRTNREDWHVCEISQLGVTSPAYRPGPYSRRENLSAAFDQEVLRRLGHAPNVGVTAEAPLSTQEQS